MTFADDRAEDLVDVFDVDAFAVAATYQVAGGVAVSLPVLVNEGGRRYLEIGTGTADRRDATILMRASDVAAPAREATITIATGDHAGIWKISKTGVANGGVIACECSISKHRERGGEQARRVES